MKYSNSDSLPAVPAFARLPSSVTWRAVYMSRQRIAELPSGAFDNLRTAKLVLNFNRLGDRVRPGALDGQGTSLAELQLAGCGITSLPVLPPHTPPGGSFGRSPRLDIRGLLLTKGRTGRSSSWPEVELRHFRHASWPAWTP